MVLRVSRKLKEDSASLHLSFSLPNSPSLSAFGRLEEAESPRQRRSAAPTPIENAQHPVCRTPPHLPAPQQPRLGRASRTAAVATVYASPELRSKISPKSHIK